MSIIITVALMIVDPPSSVTLFIGNTAEFTCYTRNAHFAYWRLNGTIVGNYDANNLLQDDVNVYLKGSISSGINTTLTIRARIKYHGLVLQCVAGVSGGGPVVESENATLMVQGTVELNLVGHVANTHTPPTVPPGLLDPVSNVRIESDTDSIFLFWSPPYSLNVTGMNYDILYTILISNVSDEASVPCSDCHNLTQPHYTFTTTNPSPCHKYKFTIISLNGAGEGGRSEPVEAFFLDSK